MEGLSYSSDASFGGLGDTCPDHLLMALIIQRHTLGESGTKEVKQCSQHFGGLDIEAIPWKRKSFVGLNEGHLYERSDTTQQHFFASVDQRDKPIRGTSA